MPAGSNDSFSRRWIVGRGDGSVAEAAGAPDDRRHARGLGDAHPELLERLRPVGEPEPHQPDAQERRPVVAAGDQRLDP